MSREAESIEALCEVGLAKWEGGDQIYLLICHLDRSGEIPWVEWVKAISRLSLEMTWLSDEILN